MGKLQDAIELLKAGKPIFIHDFSGRENEVDMVYYAPKVTTEAVTKLRKIAGGLICYVTTQEIGSKLDLRYLSDILTNAGYETLTSKTLGYGDPPNFSLWVNHKSVKTGIRDSDRAVTIRELDKVITLVLSNKVEDAKRKFYDEFVAPGHVPILLGRGIKRRRGHTELSIALAEIGGLTPSMVITEVLNEGEAMSVEDVKKLAKDLNTVVIEGDEILEVYEF
jgi:3,4-dihydroxy 2-butanone 4-phosphate synthase